MSKAKGDSEAPGTLVKDRELVAMSKCFRIIGELDEAERKNVMDWLNRKFPAKPPEKDEPY